MILFLAAATASAQMTAGMSAGFSNSHALVQGEIGYTFKNLYTGFDLRSHIYADNSAFIGSKVVYFFRVNDFHFGPAAGYYYRLATTDNKNENGTNAGYGIKAGYKWFSIETYRIGNYNQFTVGVFAFIVPKNRCNYEKY